MKTFALSLGFLIVGSTAPAQDTTGISGQEAIESILTTSTDEQDLRALGEELEYLQQHPIYIVKPNYNDLVKLPFVSPMLAEAIVLFTDTVRITSLQDLQHVSLMTDDLHAKLVPFVTLENPASGSYSTVFQIRSLDSRTRLERRLQQSQGYRVNLFRGDVTATYQRIRLGNDHVEVAGLFEKDAGELYDDGLIAGYLSLKNVALVDHLVVGNFNVSTGQGLVFAKNIATSKGSNAVAQTKKRGSVIAPSVSTDEYRYFQGAAISSIVNNFSFSGFYSERNLPASTNSLGVVTSFYTSGVYRTSNDLLRKHGVKERMLGGQIKYALDPLKSFSITLMNTEYGKPISSTLFDLRGKKSVTAGGIAWEIPVPILNFFGEVASNEGKRYSKIFGTIVPVSPRLALSFHHRTFTKGFVSPFARPFGERDIISDGESGNYIGAELRLPGVTLNSYVDSYYLPPTSGMFGTNGREFFSNAMLSPTRSIDVTLQVRNKLRFQTVTAGQNDRREQTNYRLSYSVSVSKKLSFSQRVELVNVVYQPDGYREQGFLTFLECIFKQREFGLSVKSRIVFFDTDSYDSRLYQYESDVAGNFSNPPMYGNGIRWYMVLGYDVFESFRLSMKYSETKKLHEDVVGSGDDEIIGNLDNYIALQLDFGM
ncbi:MAG: hypothetical protein AB1728_14420 [Bacteroidota bacterium]